MFFITIWAKILIFLTELDFHDYWCRFRTEAQRGFIKKNVTGHIH